MTVEFGVLGSVEGSIDGRPVALGHARQRGVLAVLLVDVDHPVTVDQLIDRAWGHHPPRQARSTLRGYLSRLRQALAATREAVIARQPGGYVLTTAGTVTVDMHSFRRLAAQARAAGDDARAAALFEQSLRLWRAEPFAALDTPWLNALRDALVQERLAAQLDLGDLRLRLGQHAALLPELSARAAAHPLDERLAGQLMLALHRNGRSAEALDHYHRTRDRLARELGIDPGPALRKIQTAVLRQDTAPGAVPQPGAPAQPSPPPAQLPLSVAAFTGRDGELARLDRLLSAAAGAGPVRPAAVVISAVSGTAGVGKTALAVHWAHRVREAFPDGQLYVNLRGFVPGGSITDPAEAVRGFLDALGVPPARIPNGLEAQAGLYRSLLAGRRVLVVLDNARDAEQVRPLLPGAPGCLALVTSRNRLTGLAATEGAHLLSVDLLTPGQARDLLAGRLGPHRTAAEPSAVNEIVTRCAGLPLALAIVAARAADQLHLPLAGLAGELREAGTRLNALDGGDPATRIRAVFSWSYRALSPDAARLLRLLGLHPGPDTALPGVAALAGLPPARTSTLVTELTRGNLLTEHTPGRYALHDLLRIYATELVTTHDSDATRRAATHRMLDHYLHTAHAADALLTPRRRVPISLAPAQLGAAPEELRDRREALDWFTAENPVALAAIEQAPAGFETHTWQLATAVATSLNRQGRWPALAAAHTTALNAAQRANDKTGQANSHHGLALVQTRLDHLADARAHYELAMDLFKELDDHNGQARIHKHLGRLSSDRGDYREALGHAHQAFTHYKAAHNMLGQAIALDDIDRYHVRLGDHRQTALSYGRQALALVEEIGDINGQAYTWSSLSYIHHHLGQYGQAIDSHRQAIDLYRKTDDRYHEATSLTDLGDTHHAAADPTAALYAWTQALAITDEISLPGTAPLRAKILHNLDRHPADVPPSPENNPDLRP
ncbi:BTAD domain-containing putative transcriptional regulator [Streptomyces sp. NPDC047070]|uniref:AfsR/SARP family transcriptional regulator n=1 Tax=Streptomyces sp. NPDC047070 TaxID=3154923 RepID=UPI0034539251